MSMLSFCYRVLLTLLIVFNAGFIVVGCDSEDSSNLNYWYVDADGDGYGNMMESPIIAKNQPAGYVINYSDCDDSDATVHPDATEDFNDDIDHDCDGCPIEVCCLTGDSAEYQSSILINNVDDLQKLKNYQEYYTKITGNLTISGTSISDLDRKELRCLDTIDGNLSIVNNDNFCDSDAQDFADDLTINGGLYIENNGDDVEGGCP